MSQTTNQSNSSQMETNINSNESYGHQDFTLEKTPSWPITHDDDPYKLRKYLSVPSKDVNMQPNSNLKFNAEPFCYGKSQNISQNSPLKIQTKTIQNENNE